MANPKLQEITGIKTDAFREMLAQYKASKAEQRSPANREQKDALEAEQEVIQQCLEWYR